MSSSTHVASKIRSTASDAKAAEKGTRFVSRESANARASSPARAGSTLLPIIPIAIARHRIPSGSSSATGERMIRQRGARSGKDQRAGDARAQEIPGIGVADVQPHQLEADAVQGPREKADADDSAEEATPLLAHD